jgi:hypothetical protein
MNILYNKPKTVIVDADDFCEDNEGWNFLTTIKKHIPNFKINLFCIVGSCSDDFFIKYKQIEWIDLIPHGWKHPTPKECINWSYEESMDYLYRIEELGLTKGFKAPGWQISDGMYKALLEKEYWVADQLYNNKRRPKGLKAYLLDEPYKYHHHIQNVCGNGLEESMEQILSLKGNFKFIKDIFNK